MALYGPPWRCASPRRQFCTNANEGGSAASSKGTLGLAGNRFWSPGRGIIRSQVVRSLILAGRISNTCEKHAQPGSGPALGAYLDPDLVRVMRGELLFFAADVFFPASVFLLLGLLDRLCFFGIGGPGASVPAVSAISSPNRAARSPSSSILAGLRAA